MYIPVWAVWVNPVIGKRLRLRGRGAGDTMFLSHPMPLYEYNAKYKPYISCTDVGLHFPWGMFPKGI